MTLKISSLLPCTALIYLATVSLTQAQVVEDDTLSTNVTTKDNRNFAIDGGEKRGGNLFHSFKEFSIPTNGSATFKNSLAIQNIFSRVTGLSPSKIDGLIKNNGSANLFLLNPQGVIFGENAVLDLGGSLITSTAESLLFEDGQEFSTKDTNSKPLLTVSTPLGLQFGKTPASITNKSQFQIPNPFNPSRTDKLKVGLSVLAGKTLALIGGDILIDGGVVTAPAGRIELGSVADNSLVTFDSLGSATYKNETQFQDITLDNLASINVSGSRGGDINLQGNKIKILNGSVISSDTLGSANGGKIEINATESLEIIGSDATKQNTDQTLIQSTGIILPVSSRITSNTFGRGNGSDIKIVTNNLFLLDGAEVELQTIENPETPGQIRGKAGNLLIRVSESIVMDGARPLLGITDNAEQLVSVVQLSLDQAIEFNQGSTISTSSFSNGAGGDINILTNNLSIKEGGLIASSPFRSGVGGNISISAIESITVEGISTRTGSANSLITSNAFGSGKGGNLDIRSDEKLTIKDGAGITANTFGLATAGNIAVKASEIELSSVSVASQLGSFISTQTTANGNAGDLTINTGDLTILDGASITVEGTGSGSPGNLEINANSVDLSDRATITAATASGSGGNIRLQVKENLTLRKNSTISSQAIGNANGGNIDIDANFVIAVPGENSDILTKAIQGDGGDITINTQRIFGLAEGRSQPKNSTNDIDASSEFGLSGSVETSAPEFEVNPDVFKWSSDGIDAIALLNNSFCRISKNSSYYVTGRGGIPLVIEGDFASNDTWEDWRIMDVEEDEGTERRGDRETRRQEDRKELKPIQGWVVNRQGKVVLTSQALVVTPQVPESNSLSCNL